MKYYILRRINRRYHIYTEDIINPKIRAAAEKRYNPGHTLVLIEKTCNKDSTEHITNVWPCSEGIDFLWKKYTKGRRVYDYTGVVHPIIHEDDKIYFFNDYLKREK